MKKQLRKVLYIISILMLIFIELNICFSYDWGTQINNYASRQTDSNVIDTTKTIAGSVVTIARVVALGIAFIMLIVLAIKYMSSAPGDRATIKKHAVVYVVGAIVMFASSGILAIIAKFASGL